MLFYPETTKIVRQEPESHQNNCPNLNRIMSKRKNDGEPTHDDHKATLLAFLTRQNRPFNQILLSSMIKPAIPKSTLQQLLVGCTKQDLVTTKTYGANLIYYAKQNPASIPTPLQTQELDAELIALETKSNALKLELAGIETGNSVNSCLVVGGLLKSETTTKLSVLLQDAITKNADLQNRVDGLARNSVRVSEIDQKQADKSYIQMRKLWKSRKSMFKNAWGLILESYPGKPGTFKEELGIEFDEDFGVSLDINPLAPNSKNEE